MKTRSLFRPGRRLNAAAILLCLPFLALATPPITEPGTLAIVCAGARANNGVPVDNIRLAELFLPADVKCREGFSASMDPVKAKVSHAGSGSSSGRAQALPGGRLRLHTSNSNSDGGETGGAIAGFTDVLTIDAPGLTGTSGWFYYRVKVKGTLETHGLSGSTFFRILPLSLRVSGWQTWAAQSDWSMPDVVLQVDETAVVVVGMVFGEPFPLATTAWALAGGSNAHGSVSFDAKDSIRLKGVDHITTYEGAPVTNYTLSSQAGLDW